MIYDEPRDEVGGGRRKREEGWRMGESGGGECEGWRGEGGEGRMSERNGRGDERKRERG